MFWSDEEIEVLKKYVPKCDIDELTKIFPHRTISAIRNKAYSLGLKREVGSNINYDYLKNLEETHEV